MEEKNRIGFMPEDGTSANFPQIDLQFRESKEEVWARMQGKLQERKPVPLIPRSFYFISAAASLLLLAGMITFFRCYTKTAYAPAGRHLTVTLPDQSEVILNSESIIAWHPFWMKFDRSIQFEGEAYFQVKKGSGFTVHSTKGVTRVLGTTFNIYSREEEYRVCCFSGSVHMASPVKNESVILHPGDQGTILKNGSVQVEKPAHLDDSKLWMDNMFIFTGAPLNSVIRELERQYNIHIRLKEDYPLTYTGNFHKSVSEKEVLDLICTSLDLKYKAKSNGEYLIYKD